MRIVMVGPFGLWPRGTMSVRALPMAKALAARGHALTLLLPPWQNPEQAGQSWEEDGVLVENAVLPRRVPGFFHPLLARRLARRALALRPDVVHLFKPKAYSGLAHWMLARRSCARRPRLVVDADDWEGTGGWNEIGPYTPAQRRFFAWQERWGLTHADAITVASRTLESLAWALGVPARQVFYVPNGIGVRDPNGGKKSTGSTNRGSHSDAARPVILLYTRFFEFPTSRVIDVLRRVRERVPGTRLLVVGKGLFGEEQELLHLARQHGLSVADLSSRPCDQAFPPRGDVTTCGLVPIEALPRLFAQATLAIYPFDDTLINRAKCAVKLLDLLGAGVPVVAEAVGQNREMIRHGESGWLVAPGDEEEFAGAVVRLLEDAPLRERLSRAAFRDVRERFTWERLAEDVESAYAARR